MNVHAIRARSCGHPLQRNVLLVTVGLFVAVALPSAAIRAQEAQPTNTAKLDVKYIPAEAHAALILHPRRLLTAPELELLPVEVISAQSVKSLGIDPLDVEQIVAFGTPDFVAGMPDYGLIARFTKPYDKAKLLPDLQAAVKEAELDGQSVWQLPAPLPSVFFADERTIVAAPLDRLRKIIKAKVAESPLLQRLRAADVGHHVTIVTSVDMAREAMKKQLEALGPLPPPVMELTKLVDHVSATEVRIDASLPLGHEAILYTRDAKSVDEIERLVKGGLKAGRDFLVAAQTAAFASLDKEDPVQQASAKYALRMTNLLFDSIKLMRREKDNALSISGLGGVATTGFAAALLLPAVQAAREAGRRAQSVNNMRQLGLAVHKYHDTKLRFPAQAIYDKEGKKKLLSWRVQLLPYLGEKALYDKFKLDEPWDSEHNKKLIPLMPAVFRNPNLSSTEYKTNYLVPVGKGTVFENGEKFMNFGRITDGAAFTIMLLEADADKAVIWTQPDDLEVTEKDPMAGLGHLRPGGFLMGRGDAAVSVIPTAVEPATLWALFTRSGGEKVKLPYLP